MWVKNITNFRRFCYLHIARLRINITLILYDFLKRWIHALVGKLKNRCFCWFPAAIFVPLKGTQTWRLHTKLYKFGSNVFPNISHMKYRTDLSLVEAFYIFIFFYFLDSGLSALNGLQFYFWLHDSKCKHFTWTGPVWFIHMIEREGDRDNLQGERSNMMHVTKRVSTVQYACTTLWGVNYCTCT